MSHLGIETRRIGRALSRQHPGIAAWPDCKDHPKSESPVRYVLLRELIQCWNFLIAYRNPTGTRYPSSSDHDNSFVFCNRKRKICKSSPSLCVNRGICKLKRNGHCRRWVALLKFRTWIVETWIWPCLEIKAQTRSSHDWRANLSASLTWWDPESNYPLRKTLDYQEKVSGCWKFHCLVNCTYTTDTT